MSVDNDDVQGNKMDGFMIDRKGLPDCKATSPECLTDVFSKLQLTEKSSISLDSPGDEYLMHIVSQNRGGDVKLAVTGSSYAVHIYTRQHLALCSTITGHKKMLTGLEFAHTSQDLLYTSSIDGTIRLWDFRSSPMKCVQSFEAPEKMPFTTVGLSHNDRCLVGGTEAKDEDVFLFFWDTRMDGGETLGCYTESHQGDITQTVFHPENHDSLITASTDGLVCLFDISQETEDDALLTSLNAEASVSQIGWCGPEASHIYCTTHIDSLHVWSSQGEFDDVVIISRDGVKEKTNKQAEYLIDCFQPTSSEDLHIVGGTSGGMVQVYRLQGSDLHSVADLTGGHTSIVRCIHWDSQSNSLVTGGEDSMLCLWTTEAPSAPFTSVLKTQAKAPSKMKSKQKKKRFKSTLNDFHGTD